MADPFAVLGLCPPCTEEEVKKAYRTLAKKHHPDKAGPSGTENFKVILAAYEKIKAGKLCSDANAQAATEPRPKHQSDPNTQPKSQPKPRQSQKPDADQRPRPTPKPEQKPKPKPESTQQPRPEPQRSQSYPESDPKPKPAPKPEHKSKTKPERTQQSQPQPQGSAAERGGPQRRFDFESGPFDHTPDYQQHSNSFPNGRYSYSATSASNGANMGRQNTDDGRSGTEEGSSPHSEPDPSARQPPAPASSSSASQHNQSNQPRCTTKEDTGVRWPEAGTAEAARLHNTPECQMLFQDFREDGIHRYRQVWTWSSPVDVSEASEEDHERFRRTMRTLEGHISRGFAWVREDVKLGLTKRTELRIEFLEWDIFLAWRNGSGMSKLWRMIGRLLWLLTLMEIFRDGTYGQQLLIGKKRCSAEFRMGATGVISVASPTERNVAYEGYNDAERASGARYDSLGFWTITTHSTLLL
ncbi:hypothetical protein OHC33_000774 [Knufia fluminis]|uniref:J domain-containing protein n=1 Tax=Knufia fluminis TaxID=191047 RepID=A0AAN8I721_9EURO|nr:hypothetical protein OHC33_000774 [Knufia fluminis]